MKVSVKFLVFVFLVPMHSIAFCQIDDNNPEVKRLSHDYSYGNTSLYNGSTEFLHTHADTININLFNKNWKVSHKKLSKATEKILRIRNIATPTKNDISMILMVDTSNISSALKLKLSDQLSFLKNYFSEASHYVTFNNFYETNKKKLKSYIIILSHPQTDMINVNLFKRNWKISHKRLTEVTAKILQIKNNTITQYSGREIQWRLIIDTSNISSAAYLVLNDQLSYLKDYFSKQAIDMRFSKEYRTNGNNKKAYILIFYLSYPPQNEEEN